MNSVVLMTEGRSAGLGGGH